MTFSKTWLTVIQNLLEHGDVVQPRGEVTLELPQQTVVVDMQRPVLDVPQRKLNYRFMAAEAYWILMGDNRVATIAPYNGNIAQFSDDGKTFFGAYGPKIAKQLPYVIDKLRQDPETRQAGLTIWRENPPETKDVPCTVAVFATIRQSKLRLNVFMRSSDIWLGLPYDVFNFAMLGHLLCAELNALNQDNEARIAPGTLYLTAASQHLYQRNMQDAIECLDATPKQQPATPQFMWLDSRYLMGTLRELRDSKRGDAVRWWEAAQ